MSSRANTQQQNWFSEFFNNFVYLTWQINRSVYEIHEYIFQENLAHMSKTNQKIHIYFDVQKCLFFNLNLVSIFLNMPGNFSLLEPLSFYILKHNIFPLDTELVLSLQISILCFSMQNVLLLRPNAIFPRSGPEIYFKIHIRQLGSNVFEIQHAKEKIYQRNMSQADTLCPIYQMNSKV